MNTGSKRSKKISRGWFLISGGFTGLLFFYLCEVLDPFTTYLDVLEVWIYRGLKSTIGINRVWDWTIFTGASPAYLFFMIGAMVLAMFSEGWKLRTHNYGRIFGYILFSIALTALALEISDGIGDEVKRVSPWNVYRDTSIEDLPEAHFIDFDKRESIPDEKVTAAACLLMLLALRLPLAALLGMLLLTYYMLCQLALGTQWFMTQAVSFLFGSVLAGTALIILRGPLRWLEQKSEIMFLTFFWRSIHGFAFPLKGETILQQEAFPKDQWDKIKRRRLQGKERFWNQVVLRDVLPVLGAREAAYQLDSRPNFPEGKNIRPSRFVRFIHLATGEIVVIKALHRLGGIFRRSSRIARYSTSAKNGLKLERLGLPVPRIYWVEDKVTTFGMRSYFLSLEEFIQGRSIDPTQIGEVDECMRLLAMLHNNARERWGSISDHHHRRRSQYTLHYLRPFVLRNLNKIQRSAQINFSEEEIGRLWKLFEKASLTILPNPVTAFRLIHGDVTVRNFLVTQHSGIRMIDFVTVRYDLVAGETIKAAIALTDGTPEACSAAWQSYFAAAGEMRWTEFLKEAKLSFALYALRELAQGRAGLGKTVELSHDAILSWILALFQIESDLWGSAPNETDWQRVLQILRG